MAGNWRAEPELREALSVREFCCLSEGAQKGRGMEQRINIDLQVGVVGAWLGVCVGGVKFGGKEHDSWC